MEPPSTPPTHPAPPGLTNRVSNCYFNSAVQSFMALPIITKRLLDMAPVDGLVGELQRLVEQFFAGHKLVDAVPLLYELNKIVKFKIGIQHDAGEFLLYLIKHLEEKFPQIATHVRGEHRIVRTCGGCGHESISIVGYNNIVLDPTAANTNLIGLMVKNSIADEIFDTFNCDAAVCVNSKTSNTPNRGATRRWSMLKIPDVLILTVVSKFTAMPKLKLNFVEFKPDDKPRYHELTSIILHHGSSTSGHYNAIIRWGKIWYFIDDTRVSIIKLCDMENMIINHTCQLIYSI